MKQKNKRISLQPQLSNSIRPVPASGLNWDKFQWSEASRAQRGGVHTRQYLFSSSLGLLIQVTRGNDL